MKTIRGVVIGCAVLALLVSVGFAQPPMAKPGPEHERLKKMEGTWDATIRTPAGESKGTMTYKMELGGLWLVSDFKGEFGGQKFEGKGFDGYDPAKKKYVSVWVDSMSLSPMLSEGTFDKEGKVLTQLGDGPGMDGKMTKYKSVTEMKDPNTILFTLSTADKEGKDQTMLTILYKRKK
ncbi:MAG TPA: DUF1579 domain-containing protein [Gemmataceae bacterium]|nr:DUF1579 domain-containing protein [Gemmataceae bacterium]